MRSCPSAYHSAYRLIFALFIIPWVQVDGSGNKRYLDERFVSRSLFPLVPLVCAQLLRRWQSWLLYDVIAVCYADCSVYSVSLNVHAKNWALVMCVRNWRKTVCVFLVNLRSEGLTAAECTEMFRETIRVAGNSLRVQSTDRLSFWVGLGAPPWIRGAAKHAQYWNLLWVLSYRIIFFFFFRLTSGSILHL